MAQQRRDCRRGYRVPGSVPPSKALQVGVSAWGEVGRDACFVDLRVLGQPAEEGCELLRIELADCRSGVDARALGQDVQMVLQMRQDVVRLPVIFYGIHLLMVYV